MIIIQSKLNTLSPFVALEVSPSEVEFAYRELTYSKESAKKFFDNYDGPIVYGRDPCQAGLKLRAELVE